MEVSETQLAVLIMLVTGAIGARRGWGRELITCAIVLGALLFLQLGGTTVLSNLVTTGLTPTASASAAGSASCSGGSVSTMSSSKTTSELIFSGLVWVGYYVGGHHGAAADTGAHRLLGIVPGVITGGAISYYLNTVLYPGTAVFLQWLGAVGFLASLPLLLGVGLVMAFVTLLYSWRSGKTSKGH